MLKLLLLIVLSILYLIGVGFVKQGKDVVSTFDLRATVPLRGVLAILIVAGHVCNQQPQMPFSSEIGGLAYIVVAIFFFLSGYGLMISLVKKGDAYLDNFLSKHFLKIVPLFVLCNVVYICFIGNYPPHFYSMD
jgi:peptidoglycan/LPS O-acetylase OafA/YrhL